MPVVILIQRLARNEPASSPASGIGNAHPRACAVHGTGAAARGRGGRYTDHEGDACTQDQILCFRGFSARLENDLFADTDRYYTNGVSLTLVSKDLPATFDPRCLPWPVQVQAALIEHFDPDFWRDGDQVARSQNVVLRLGQSIYTPGDRSRTDLILNDRPYAGLLYLGLAWNRRRHDPRTNSETLDTREVTAHHPLDLRQGKHKWWWMNSDRNYIYCYSVMHTLLIVFLPK